MKGTRKFRVPSNYRAFLLWTKRTSRRTYVLLRVRFVHSKAFSIPFILILNARFAMFFKCAQIYVELHSLHSFLL